MFSPVNNLNVIIPDYGKPVVPYTKENLGTFQRFKPVLDKDEVLISWVLPYC